jgi:hypothetical protein
VVGARLRAGAGAEATPAVAMLPRAGAEATPAVAMLPRAGAMLAVPVPELALRRRPAWAAA